VAVAAIGTAIAALLVAPTTLAESVIHWHQTQQSNAKDKADLLNAVEALKNDIRGTDAQSFTLAVDQIASDNLDRRIGGIIALEILMTQSPERENRIIDLLAAHIRSRTVGTVSNPAAGPPEDLRVALTVLGKRPDPRNHRNVDLSRANLTGAKLMSMDLVDADLIDTVLTRADLTGTDLANAKLTRAIGVDMTLTDANLNGANLRRANMVGAILTGTSLVKAQLDQVNLTGAYLADANLSGANLANANLTGAILTGADLTGCDLNPCQPNGHDID